MARLYTVRDAGKGEVVLGLEGIEATNGSLLRLIPEQSLTNLAVGEYARATDGTADRKRHFPYAIWREKDGWGKSREMSVAAEAMLLDFDRHREERSLHGADLVTGEGLVRMCYLQLAPLYLRRTFSLTGRGMNRAAELRAEREQAAREGWPER